MSEYDITQPDIDRADKAILWLAVDVLEQGVGNAAELYGIMELHFRLKSRWANYPCPTIQAIEEQLQ